MSNRARHRNTKGFGNAKPTEVMCPKCGGTGKVTPETITIGDRIRACRMELGKTQEEMAPALGITRAQMANLEGDRGRPGLETLVKAADAFSVSIDYLLGRH